MKKIKLSEIRTDATQTRFETNQSVLAEYADAMSEGAVFPAIVVFHDGADYWLADGFHRVLASIRVMYEEIEADVRKGGMVEALEYALSANVTNGLRRTNADKRKCVELALRQWPKLSDRSIAEKCAVSQPFVSEQRQLITVISSPRTSTGRDGKERTYQPKERREQPTREAPEPVHEEPAIEEPTASESENLTMLKHYWKRSNKKDKKDFISWLDL